MRSVTKRRLTNGLAVILGLAPAGCGGSKSTTPSPEGSIAITISPTSATIEQGGTATATATLTRAGGFTGAVTIAVEGAPAGVAGAASNVQTTGTTTTATITITVDAATVPGSYTLRVRGRGTGVTAAETSFALTVTAKPAYTLALSPNALSIPQGGNAPTTVTITRVNFAGAVTLSLGGAPTGVTGSFNPAAPTGTSSTLTVTVGATVPPGTYNLTVNGTATAGDQSAPLTLTVMFVIADDFDDAGALARWDIALRTEEPPFATTSESNPFTGGVPGSPGYREGRHDLTTTAPPSRNTRVDHILRGDATHPGMYDPTAPGAGPVDHLVVSMYRVVTHPSNPGAMVGSFFVVRQGGNLFYAHLDPGDFFNNLTWQKVTKTIVASDFTGAVPDFNAPMEFGFRRTVFFSSANNVFLSWGTDQFRVEVWHR